MTPGAPRAVGFLHTADEHVGAFGDLLTDLAPDVSALHRVDVPLLAAARAGAPVAERLRDHLESLAAAGAAVVVCTCSTLGAVAEQVPSGVPVLRVDRPMAEDAVRDGGVVAVVVALASTLEPSTELVADAARRAGTQIELVPVVCDDAWRSFEAGDRPGYHREVVRTVRDVVRSARPDVVVLAQASMAPAAIVLADLPVRVVASPSSAVARAVATVRASG